MLGSNRVCLESKETEIPLFLPSFYFSALRQGQGFSVLTWTFFFWYFETGFLHVDLIDLELTL